MKTNFKNEMITMVKGLGTEVDGKIQMTKKNLNKIDTEIGNGSFGGKFLLIQNKKNPNLYAVVYKTKKSDRVIIIEVIKPVKAEKVRKAKTLEEKMDKERATIKVYRQVKEDGRKYKIIKVFSFGVETGFETWVTMDNKKRNMVKRGNDLDELIKFVEEQ